MRVTHYPGREGVFCRALFCDAGSLTGAAAGSGRGAAFQVVRNTHYCGRLFQGR